MADQQEAEERIEFVNDNPTTVLSGHLEPVLFRANLRLLGPRHCRW